ncbi:MAG: hypothetical protein UU08_C0017G0014 [Candidatus Uhrbacteria bacterium GW2011_GWE2_40_58]|nr:MAG: hypothetical protein UT94_C0019G0014 [Candidatus Uhrbacteria bacterium GW2011_GWF2_40_263]KKR67455.1 MAG: hypothetical protein UU08_C0017G0014 [Candidatus Uhrbacteria bacterium GW2011_GWE2_40_58]OGL94462.1 MAG: hypothetical protein A2239_01220 [Candidatus Uhrbacteria bacterium RIFOXYA2_FULL_40_9]OGL98294.1 MAG: hypothetical protein A2332_05055 [Candidatus Uhrbacteria bacterium RIFOXYB2_FULL_41_18]HCB55706.1 hypothetical protein [Candidatus Uhrbacteria bacterium]
MDQTYITIRFGVVSERIFLALIAKCDELDKTGLTRGDEWVGLVRQFSPRQPPKRFLRALVESLAVRLDGDLVVPNREIVGLSTKTGKQIWPLKSSVELTDSQSICETSVQGTESEEMNPLILSQDVPPVELTPVLFEIYERFVAFVLEQKTHRIGYEDLSKMVLPRTVGSALFRLKEAGCLENLPGEKPVDRLIVLRPYRLQDGVGEVIIPPPCRKTDQEMIVQDLSQITSPELVVELIRRLHEKRDRFFQEREAEQSKIRVQIANLQAEIVRLQEEQVELQERLERFERDEPDFSLIDAKTAQLETFLREFLS